MKIYLKLLGKIQNNKTRAKKAVGIVAMAVKLRYGSIHSIPTNLSSNSTQQVEQVHNPVHNYVEEDMQVINTDVKVKDGLIHKSSSNLIKTGSGAVIAVRTSVPPSEALKSTLEIRSGSIEGAEASTVDGFVVKPPISRPSCSKSLNSQTFGAKTSLDNDSPDSDDSEDGTCSSPYSSSEYLDQLLSETLDNVHSSSVSSSNNHQISEVPEVSLDYEISDSEEIYDEESNDSDDKQIYSNSMSPGYKSAKHDSYTDSVYQYKYSTSPSRLGRFLRREIYANKKEHELFSKDRTQDDLTSASKINISDKRLKDKIWRHPDFFGLTKSKSSSRTPKEDFVKQHGEDAKTQLKEHLVSPHTRCFKNGLYREHQESYDYYYNNQTGKLLLIKNNGKTGEQEIFSFWTISKMQRLELLNHNHVHKHWKLVEALRKKNVEEKALVEAQNAQKRELNEVVSPVEAARRAGEYIKKNSKTNNDI